MKQPLRVFQFLLAGLLCLFSTRSYSQKIEGKIVQEGGQPLSGVTVSLQKAGDSSIVKLAVSGPAGEYAFAGVPPGRYLIQFSHIGYVTLRGAPFLWEESAVAQPTVQLRPASGSLADITVTARKPLIEVKADRTILNVEGAVNAAGKDAFELLRKAPGVNIDKDDNLSMGGKNGLQVYIDGRPTPLSGQDLSTYLKTLPSSQIEALELITNPSAKYDAAGNAGIINIRLKKNTAFGTNGSVSSTLGYGSHFRYSGSGSLNHRSRRLNLFGTYSYTFQHSDIANSNYRIVLDTLFDQTGQNRIRIPSQNLKAGMDFSLNEKSTLGLLFNGNFSHMDITTENTTPIIYLPTGERTRILIGDNINYRDRSGVSTNLNYSFVDGAKKSLALNADYSRYQNHSDQLQPNVYYDASGKNETGRIVYRMITPSAITLYSLKGDYEQDYKKGKLGVGFKTSFVKTDNDFQRYDVYASATTLDRDRSNRFYYQENINALYFNYNSSVKSWVVQAGLRAEYTFSQGRSAGLKNIGGSYRPYDSSFSKAYAGLFPSAAVTYNGDPNHQWSLTYSRRIDRPYYQDLNPFEYKVDEYLFAKGNIHLKPQYTNSLGVGLLYRMKLNTTLNYSHVTDIFSILLDTAERSKIVQSKKNLASQNMVSLDLSYSYQRKKFSSFLNANAYYSQYKADFGPGRTIDLDAVAVAVNVQNAYKLSPVWTAELSANYNSPTVVDGTFRARAMYSVDAGIQKLIFKGDGNLKLAVSDLFKTFQFRGTSNFAGQYLSAVNKGDSRVVRLTASYRFGNKKVKLARQRSTGLDEESKRIQ